MLYFSLQGKADNFLTSGQLLPDNLTVVCAKKDMPLKLRMQDVRLISSNNFYLYDPIKSNRCNCQLCLAKNEIKINVNIKINLYLKFR